QGKPIEGPHISKEIEGEIVVTDVEVTRQALSIARRDKSKAKAVVRLAHAKLTKKLFEVENSDADDSVKERVVEIVKDAGTDPMLVDDSVLPEIQRRQVKNLIDDSGK